MTPEEKAKVLVDKMYNVNYGFINELEGGINHAKQCALICVDEILKVEKGYYGNRETKYWQEVKQEIKKL